jgi:hypothetical protein
VCNVYKLFFNNEDVFMKSITMRGMLLGVCCVMSVNIAQASGRLVWMEYEDDAPGKHALQSAVGGLIAGFFTYKGIYQPVLKVTNRGVAADKRNPTPATVATVLMIPAVRVLRQLITDVPSTPLNDGIALTTGLIGGLATMAAN